MDTLDQRVLVRCQVCDSPVMVHAVMAERPVPRFYCSAHRPALVPGQWEARARHDLVTDRAQAIREAWARRVAALDPTPGAEAAEIGEKGRVKTAAQVLAAAAHRFDGGERAVVVLVGPPGTGKTRAGIALVNRLMSAEQPPQVKAGLEMDLLAGPRWNISDAAADLLQAEVLFVDDVGMAPDLNKVDVRAAAWQRIVDGHLTRPGRSLLILTTNLMPPIAGQNEQSELVGWLGGKAWSRIQALGGAQAQFVTSPGADDWRPRLAEFHSADG